MKCACFESARKKIALLKKQNQLLFLFLLNRRRILAKQLGDFVHIYDKVSLLLQNKYMFCVRATLTEVYF